MRCTLNYFSSSVKYSGRTIIKVSTPAVDELTGVAYDKELSYLLVGSFYLKPFIGKEVELTLVKSPKLGFEVCTDIKLVETSETPLVEMF